MIEPKTPLPWLMVGNGYIEREGRQVLGRLYAAEDAAYAVHAANLLLDVTEALRECASSLRYLAQSFTLYEIDRARADANRTLEKARAALAKAEAT